MIRVAVILVNWNGREVTLDCLRSLREVRYDDLDVIVVDNASSDGSVESIRRDFPDVHLMVMDRNLRFAGGNNAGIARAFERGAAMVMLLNNDTTVDPDLVEALIARMNSDQRCGMVAPKIYYHGEPDMIWYAGGEISFWTGTMRHVGIRERDYGQHDLPMATQYATGCCILVKKEVIEQVGVLDESYFIYGEDADWCMRVRRAGYSVWYEPNGKVWHKLSVTAGGHLSKFKLWNKYKSSWRFFSRYARWYHWFVFPWLHIPALLFTTVRYFVSVRTNNKS
jgi:GT2 family glycosyltransferase